MSSYKLDDAGLVPGDHDPLLECPTCGLLAEITDRFTLDGAPAPVENVKLVCVRRHWYTLPVDQIPMLAPVADQAESSGVPQRG